MGFVDGLVVRDRATAERVLAPEVRPALAESIVDTLAAIHAVDLDAVGLGDLGRHEGYIARQLKRWYGQWNSSKTRELPAVDEVHDALQARIPEQGPAAIVHGDYRLDNCMVGPEGAVRGRARLGDLHARRPPRRRRPAAGLLDRTQRRAAAPGPARPRPPPASPTAPRCSTATPTVSGRDLKDIEFYIAFAFWKLACILEGVYARYVGGALGELRPRRSSTTSASRSSNAAAQAAERDGAAAVTDAYELHDQDLSLDEPVLVIMLLGWIDAGGAAASAMSVLENELAARPVATFDADTFIDYRARRPTMQLRDGVNTETGVARDPAAGRPRHRRARRAAPHRPRARRQLAAVHRCGVAARRRPRCADDGGPRRLPVRHARTADPSRLSMTAGSAEVANSLPYLRNSVDVPAGIEAALERRFTEVGRARRRPVGAGAALRLQRARTRRRAWPCSTG